MSLPIILLTFASLAFSAPQFGPPGGGFPPPRGFGGPPPPGFGGPPPFGGQPGAPGMGGPPMGIPPVPRELPPVFLNVLPQEAITQLKAVHESNTLTNEEKHDQIDKIMSSLPAEVLDRLPTPPAFEKLPQEVKDRLKDISRDKTLNWRQKHENIQKLMMSLPESVKRLLPPPPPPGFELLPEETKAQLQAIHEDRNLGFRERYFKVKEVMDKLPAEIRNKMPPPPPPPGGF